MAYKVLLVFCCVSAIVTSQERGRVRKSKFISFDSNKNDIDVSLDFNIPFLSIPIKKTVDSMLDGLPGLAIPKINLNPSALAFGGFIVLATSVFLPIFSKSFTYDTERYYRVLDNRNGELNILTDFTNRFKSVSSGCPPRLACWLSQRSNGQVPVKTMEQIIRNKLVSSIFNTTFIEEAIINGRRGYDCATYQPCPMQEEQLSVIMRNIGILASGNFN